MAAAAETVGAGTVTSVFGGDGVQPKIPEDAWNAFKEMAKTLGMGKEQGQVLKEEYVKILNSPGMVARRTRGEIVWVPVVRMTQAFFTRNVFGPTSHPFLVYPLASN